MSASIVFSGGSDMDMVRCMVRCFPVFSRHYPSTIQLEIRNTRPPAAFVDSPSLEQARAYFPFHSPLPKIQPHLILIALINGF